MFKLFEKRFFKLSIFCSKNQTLRDKLSIFKNNITNTNNFAIFILRTIGQYEVCYDVFIHWNQSEMTFDFIPF